MTLLVPLHQNQLRMRTEGYLLLMKRSQNSYLVMSACKKYALKSVLQNPNEILAGKI